MTELAAGGVSSLLGAVSSLLVVVRDEALLLGGVKDDVQFIKDEMESMNSFLVHLARSTPPGGEHDEQVRTWMTQVQLLAQDCHNCIDLYMYSGNLDIHRAKGRLRRYLWWVYWFLRKLFAQHRAAVQLRQLKDRARDVAERRLRYGVEVPGKSTAGQSPPVARLALTASSWALAGGYAAEDDEEDGDDDQVRVAATADHSGQRALFSRTLDDYVKAKLWEWRTDLSPKAADTMSIAIVDPDRDLDALSLVYETGVFHLGYNRAVFIDIPALHLDFSPLRPKEVLFYILRQLKPDLNSQSQSQKQGTDQVEGEEVLDDFWQLHRQKCHIYKEKKEALCKIKEKIEKMKIYEKLDDIKNGLKTLRPESQQKKDMDQKDPDVHVLLKQLLQSYVPASQQDQLMKNKDLPKLSASENTIMAVAKKLREYMEAVEQGVQNDVVEEDRGGVKENVQERGGGGGEIVEECGGAKKIAVEEPGGADDNGGGEERKIYLHQDQYVHILRQVFLNTSTSNKSSAMQATHTILGEDQIKQMINESKQEILRELQEGKHDRIQERGQNTEAVFKEIVDQKMAKIKHEFKQQLKIKGLVDDIKCQLKEGCPLFILKIDRLVDLKRWEDTRNALTLLECCADVLIITTTKDIKQAKEYSYPPENEPIDYSLAGLYYHTVLEIIKQQKNEGNYDPKIFRDILEQCEPNEFCMMIFTHALYVNPRRSDEELNKLHRILQDPPKSSHVIAKKMFKFSYTDMPKEYKACLLYLAIFPPGYKIRRSTLIGRWVAEGLIVKEDWPSSVRRANRCFDEIISRRLADPAETSAAGKVKSCMVGDQVHGFITKIARKQHIVEARLSQHLARHFSIFNDLQLLSSNKIDGFLQRLSKSSRVSLLKVLDLEGCQCFGGKNQRYLKDICTKMLLLKYLSLRRTDATQLPSEINNLHELEVLDIRQTNVPVDATANVLLLKLKRLLAGHTDRSQNRSAQIPHKIEKMVNMEVLSNVKACSSRDLKGIEKLWQLRKLGVVVDDNSSYLENLLRAISNLHECLCTLSISLPIATSHELPEESLKLKHQPKLLESLSISGTTQKGHLLPLFVKDANNNLVKLTLSSTSLYQRNLKVLAKLPKLQFMRLRHIEFTDIESLIFKQDEFISLKYLLVEGSSSFTKISFEDEAACMLEKVALSFTNIESVSGVHGLQKLEQVELSMSSSSKKKNGTLLQSFSNGKQIMAKLTLVSTSLEQGDQQIQNMITFNEGEFEKLKLLTVDCSAITEVVFTRGSAPKLEKIVCSSSTSLSGTDNLPRWKVLEFNGDLVPEKVKQACKNHKNKPNLIHNKPETKDQAKGDEQAEEEEDDDAAARFSLFCCKEQA